jgi:hypothetical protein
MEERTRKRPHGSVTSGIAVLRSIRRKAIAPLDFDADKRAGNEIGGKHEADNFLHQKYEPEITDCITRTAVGRVCAIQLKFHTFLKDLKTKQLAILARLEAKYSDSGIRENHRRVSKQLELLKNAWMVIFSSCIQIPPPTIRNRTPT